MNSVRLIGHSTNPAMDHRPRIMEVGGTKVKGTMIKEAMKGELNHYIKGSDDERRY